MGTTFFFCFSIQMNPQAQNQIKNARLKFLQKEIKLDEEAKKKKEKQQQQQGGGASGIALAAQRRAALASGSVAYQRAVDPHSKSVGRNIPLSKLYVDAFDLLKKLEKALELDEILRKLDVSVETEHRGALDSFLRTNQHIVFTEGAFKYRSPLAWVKSKAHLCKFLQDSPTGVKMSTIEPLYPNANKDLQSMIGKRQVLKVVSATKRKKVEEFRIFWNHYHSFEIEGMNSILRDAWKEIPFANDPVEFERQMLEEKLILQKQEKKIIKDEKVSGQKRKRQRNIKIQN